MKLIGWSARGFDGLFHNIEAMAGQIFRFIQPGTIILLHEGRRDRPGRPINLSWPKPSWSGWQAEGYVFTVPDEGDLFNHELNKQD